MTYDPNAGLRKQVNETKRLEREAAKLIKRMKKQVRRGNIGSKPISKKEGTK